MAHMWEGQAAPGSPAPSETSHGEAHSVALDDFSISQLWQFFELLDEWDRKPK
jgi:hypothetical protein